MPGLFLLGRRPVSDERFCPPKMLCCLRSVADPIPFEFSTVGFRDPQRAEENLRCVRDRVYGDVAETLLPLLSESSNPDAALNLFERLTAQSSGEVLRLLDRHRFLVHYAVVVFATSQWLGETLIQNADLFANFVRDRGLDRLRTREEFRENFARVRSRSFETDISLLLARFKKREYVRIMLRDVLGMATLADTTAEISALSDVLIEEALRECEAALKNRYGVPQHKDSAGRYVDTPFTVLSLGKLGGNELNYSSDVDLLYLYAEAGDSGTTISNREFYIRLAQEVTEVLSRMTREGAVFRIDLRLRPQGKEGEPAVPLAHALHYYAEAGASHDWELQALIKVRHSAGDQPLAREFIRRVQPMVYRSELNFEAIKTAMQALQKMKAHRMRAAIARILADTIDVKIDRGGIRDIEFLVQCLQRVYGGTEPWLRSGGTLFSLQKLHDKNHISGKDFHQLTTAYEFLRRIEHRLQLQTGLQMHRLPGNEDELRVLWNSVNKERENVSGAEVVEAIRSRMQSVTEIYDRILHHEQQQRTHGIVAQDLHLVPPVGEGGREQTYSQILSRLATDAPQLYRIAIDAALGTVARRNLYRFLGAACTSSERYAFVVGAPEAIQRALPIFAHSDFLTDILVRHPEEIAAIDQIAVADHATPRLFERESDCALRDRVIEFAANSADASEAMSVLRKQYRYRIFASGARDVLLHRDAFESLAENSVIADAAITAALQLAKAPAGFAVFALGRLGTREFDVLSDADLLFVRDEATDPYESAKAAERMMEMLAAYTRDGSVFPVDTRLRPHGTEGELVITASQMNSYFASEAQAWESLTYTKLRYVAGDRELLPRAQQSVVTLFQRFSSHPEFGSEVCEMRKRLEIADGAAFNFKTSPGGFYDIDFLACYFCVRNQRTVEPQNIVARIRAIESSGNLSAADASELVASSLFLRTLEHAVRLVDGRSRKSLPVSEVALASTTALAASILQREFPEGLDVELRSTLERVRRIFLDVLGK